MEAILLLLQIVDPAKQKFLSSAAASHELTANSCLARS